jgi:hypothetical protein
VLDSLSLLAHRRAGVPSHAQAQAHARIHSDAHTRAS